MNSAGVFRTFQVDFMSKVYKVKAFHVMNKVSWITENKMYE